jgi:hypothetical protein
MAAAYFSSYNPVARKGWLCRTHEYGSRRDFGLRPASGATAPCSS